MLAPAMNGVQIDLKKLDRTSSGHGMMMHLLIGPSK